ncbi:MAG: signal peptidase I [Bacteroidota bacterium]
MSDPTTQPDSTASGETASNGRAATSKAGRKKQKKEKVKPTFKENVRFWIKAIIVILILRAFIFEPYRIPSESMEDTLLVGDFLIVSKLHYGARTPNTIGIPFTRIYVPGLVFPQTRLPGFSEPQRGDVAVFNYPAGTDVERGAIPRDVPVERRAPYIKRLVAMPGDTLSIIDKSLSINLKPVPLSETMKQQWLAYSTDGTRPNARELEEAGYSFEGSGTTPDGRAYFAVVATPEAARQLEARDGIAEVTPAFLPDSVSFRDRMGPIADDLVFGPAQKWNWDQYGALVIPSAGMTIDVTRTTMETYSEVLEQYEGVEVTRTRGGGVLLNGVERDTYTFKQNYYCAMGDNRDNSVVSRYWGLVPETHLVGKAVFKFLSFKGEFPFVRPGRFFRPIQ